MLKVQEIRELIKLVDQSSINEFKYENEGTKITMKKSRQEDAVTVMHQQPQAAVVQAPLAPPVSGPAVESIQQEQEAAGPENSSTDKCLHKITSPMVGTFYQSPSPDEDVYVKTGSKVNKESIVCIVEAMKLFNEIEAEINGEIVEILVKDGQLVEYGQPLFLVKPE